MRTRILLKAAYYEVLWQREPALRDAYRALLDLPESELPAGIDRLRREWKLPADAWRDVLPALRRGDSGSDDACPFLSLDAKVIQRKGQELPEPPPDVPQGSTLPAYSPEDYSTFEQYLQALRRAYKGLESPTVQEREYLQAWVEFAKHVRGAGVCETVLEPPLSGILPYMPDAESREQYIRYALAQADCAECAYWLPHGYGAWLSEGERRELARLVLEGYCRAVELQAKRKGVRLRREQGRELTWEQAQAWAEWVYLRLHRGWSWGQIVVNTAPRYGKMGRSRVEQAVKRSAALLGLESVQ